MQKFFGLLLIISALLFANLAFAKNHMDDCKEQNLLADIEFTDNNEPISKYLDEIKSKSMDSMDPFQLLFTKNHQRWLNKKLSSGFDINSCGGPLDSSLLGLAAATGQMDDVKMLIEHGANLEYPKDSSGMSALMLAISNNRYEVANYLIKKGADMKTTSLTSDNKYKFSALDALATSLNDKLHNETEELSLARKLISVGISPNKITIQRTTPLMMAVITGKTELVKLFVECGADPYIKNQKGRNSFDIAKRLKRENMLEILQQSRPASGSVKGCGPQ